MQLMLACGSINFSPQEEFLLLSIVALWLAAPALVLINLVLILRRPKDRLHAHAWLFLACLVLGFAWSYAPALIMRNNITALIYAFGIPNLLLAHFACLAIDAWRRRRSRQCHLAS
jgi:hypothetical protein